MLVACDFRALLHSKISRIPIDYPVIFPEYTHVTGDMQRTAAEIVGDFMTEILGEEMRPWQNKENEGTGASI